MRKTTASLLISCLLLSGTAAAESSAYQAPLVTESLLLDISQSASQLVAVGERGHIVRSNDGLTWQQDDVPNTATLTAITHVGEKSWAVGHDAAILHKASADAAWQVQYLDAELEKPFLDVLFFDKQHGIAIGAYGLFFRTEDGGQTWQKEMHPEFLGPDDLDYLNDIRQEDESFYQQELASILPHLNRVTRAGDSLYLAGEAGLLAVSDDMGRSWQRLEVNYYGSFFDISQVQDGSVYAAGLRGNVYKLAPDAERWQKVTTRTTSSINSILPLANDRLLMVGNNGSLLCFDGDALQATQTDEKQAVVSVVKHQDKLIAVTAGGIKTLFQNASSSPCAEDVQ